MTEKKEHTHEELEENQAEAVATSSAVAENMEKLTAEVDLLKKKLEEAGAKVDVK